MSGWRGIGHSTARDGPGWAVIGSFPRRQAQSGSRATGPREVQAGSGLRATGPSEPLPPGPKARRHRPSRSRRPQRLRRRPPRFRPPRRRPQRCRCHRRPPASRGFRRHGRGRRAPGSHPRVHPRQPLSRLCLDRRLLGLARRLVLDIRPLRPPAFHGCRVGFRGLGRRRPRVDLARRALAVRRAAS